MTFWDFTRHHNITDQDSFAQVLTQIATERYGQTSTWAPTSNLTHQTEPLGKRSPVTEGVSSSETIATLEAENRDLRDQVQAYRLQGQQLYKDMNLYRRRCNTEEYQGRFYYLLWKKLSEVADVGLRKQMNELEELIEPQNQEWVQEFKLRMNREMFPDISTCSISPFKYMPAEEQAMMQELLNKYRMPKPPVEQPEKLDAKLDKKQA
jgi:hypothetical protein